ncbi:MAG: prolyl-tRNA synthetase associated domain-containing protein [Bacteroidales bacterium]|jgi:Ala-tRNA(Pro) deacylase|nr:prolyl-tRNA synthetase associated domain-containing protein [Bacteroidales bacterium]
MNGDVRLYEILKQLSIEYQYIEHPPAPTIELAKQYVSQKGVQRCKNLFLRNHKGNQHFLVVLDCNANMDIHSIEKMLCQGKLSFASATRLQKYLGVEAGSVTPLGLFNDLDNEVLLFLDEHLQSAERLSFHPLINTASLVISQSDFMKFLAYTQTKYQWMKLY